MEPSRYDLHQATRRSEVSEDGVRLRVLCLAPDYASAAFIALFFFLAFLLSWYPYLLGKTHLVRTSGGINPLGPAVAALIVAGIFYRWRGIKELMARYLPWRAHWTNYAIAFALPVLLVALAAAINMLLGARRIFSTCPMHRF